MVIENKTLRSATNLPMADGGSLLSTFSFHKVYALVMPKTSPLPQRIQNTSSQPIQKTVDTNNPQQDASGRSTSICTRVKTMLTPTESTAIKLKICAVVLSVVAIIAVTNGVVIGGLAAIIILCKLNIIVNVAIGVTALFCSACVSMYLATALYITSYSFRYNSQDDTYISRPEYHRSNQSIDISDSGDSRTKQNSDISDSEDSHTKQNSDISDSEDSHTKQNSDISDSGDSRTNKMRKVFNSRYPRTKQKCNIVNTGYRDTNQSNEHILTSIRSLYKALEKPNLQESFRLGILFKLTKEIQNLSFLSGNSSYDNARKTLVRYFQNYPQLREPLLQYAIEQDNNTLNKMQEEIASYNDLSLERLDAYHELLEESTNTPEDTPNTKAFKIALAHRLISELSSASVDQKIVNASDARRRLTRLDEDVITETSDEPNPMEIQNGEPQEITSNINDLIEKLHYTHRLFSLLNSCYPSLGSATALYPLLQGATSALSNEQRTQLTQCNEIYKNLRGQLLHLCSNINDPSPRIWALGAIVRQLNRTWIERYKDQPFPYNHDKSPISFQNECSIALNSFDEIAPTVEQADNIVIFDAENNLYDKESLMAWAESKKDLPRFESPISHEPAHIMDIVPLTKILNMKQFTIESILPAALPLDFMKKQGEAT